MYFERVIASMVIWYAHFELNCFISNFGVSWNSMQANSNFLSQGRRAKVRTFDSDMKYFSNTFVEKTKYGIW